MPAGSLAHEVEAALHDGPSGADGERGSQTPLRVPRLNLAPVVAESAAALAAGEAGEAHSYAADMLGGIGHSCQARKLPAHIQCSFSAAVEAGQVALQHT